MLNSRIHKNIPLPVQILLSFCATLNHFRVNLVASDFPTSVNWLVSCSPHPLFALQVMLLEIIFECIVEISHYQVIKYSREWFGIVSCCCYRFINIFASPPNIMLFKTERRFQNFGNNNTNNAKKAPIRRDR